MWRAMLWVAVAASLWSLRSAKGASRDGWPRCNDVMNTPGITLPMGDIALLMHNDLVITCLLDPEQAQTLGVDASNLKFFRNADEVKPNSTHKLITINDTALQLQVMDMQPSEGVYYCYVVQPDASRSLVCSNQVVVGTVPQNVTDFHCESNSWCNLTCMWRPDVVNYVLTNYSLQIKYDGRPGRKHPGHCPKIEYDEGYYKCSWTSHSDPAYRQGVESFKFELKGSNKFGVNTQVMSFNHFGNVKPAPPVDLRVQNLSSHMATIAWSIHYSMYHFPKNLIHKVKYCSELDVVPEWKEAFLNPPLDRRNLTYDLELPYPNIRYDVRVYIRTDVLRNDLWSNFSSITFRTNSTIPERPPKVDIGSFDSVVVGDKRKVFLYWQQIERYEENGDNFSYIIIDAKINTKQVSLTPSEVTNSYMIFDNLTLHKIEIHIKSNNLIGLSENETVMIIPESEKILPKPSQFTKIEYEQGLYELSWIKVDHPDLVSYTIFWCANNRDIFRCENRVQWETVSKDINVKNISVSDNLPYQFAISANSKTSSSGMVWAQCTIVHQKSISKISNVWVNRVENTSIEIDWKIECSDRIGIIQGYTIEYCPIYSLYNKTCKEEKLTVETTKHLSYTITNLYPMTTYSIQVAIKTANNVGIMSDPIFHTTSEGIPTPPINVTISDIRDHRLFVSWKPPLKKNGHLKYYRINVDSIHNCDNVDVDAEKANGINSSENETIPEKVLTNLTSYTNYTIRVQACIIFCSNASTPIKIRTAIGRPGKVEQLEVNRLLNSSSNVRLTWSPPEKRGGDIDYYEVKVTKVIDDNTNESEIFNSTTNQYDIPSTVCLKEGIKGVYLYVRAVNVDNRIDHGVIVIEGSEFVTISKRPPGDNNTLIYEGPWSSDKYNICIQNTENYFYFFYILLAIILIPAATWGFRYLWIHFQNMQNIKPCLPAGLGNLEKEPIEKKPLNARWNPLGTDDKMNRLNSDHSLDRGINTGDFSNGIITDNCNDSENTDSTCVPSLASSSHSESDGNKDGREPHDGQSETVSANSSPRSRNIGSSSSRPDSAASANLFDQNPHTIGNDTMGPYTTIGDGINFSIQPEPRSENINANGYVSVGTLTNSNLFNPDKPSTVLDNLPFVSFQPNRPSDNIVPRIPKPQLSSGYVPNGTNFIFAPNNAPSDKTSLNNSLIHIIDPTGSDKDYDFEDESIFDKLPNENNAVSNKPVMINGYVKRNEPDFMSDVDTCIQKMFSGGPAQVPPKQNNLTNIVVPLENTAATEDAISPEAYCRFGPNINVPQQFEFHRSDEDSEDILLSSMRNPDEFEYEKHSLLEKTTHSDPSVPSSHYVPINLQNVNKP